jgi:hypothetical protein
MTSNIMDNLLENIKSRVGEKVEMAKYVKIAPIERENVSKGWVNFGEGNMYPQYLIELQSESPVHGSIVNSISQMVAGQGVSGGNDTANAYLSGLKIDSIIPSVSRDLKLFGGYYLEVIWSMDRTTIAQVNHLPFENCRLACSDENDDVIGIWYSRDWSDTRKKKNTPHFIAMFDEENKEALPKQVLFVHTLKMGSEYYPKPDYIGSVNYIELTRQIGEYHVNNILNGFFPSLIASFNNGIPSLEEQHMIKNQLQMSIQGAENAGKVLTFFNEERDRGVEFTPFPVHDADKQYQFLSEECTKQIMIAHRVTSPLLFGVRDGGGLGSNTDEMKTALFIFQKQVIEPFQRLIEDGISIICEASNVVATPKIISNDILEPTPVEAQQSAVKKKVKCEHTHVSQADESYAPTDEMAGEAELGLKWREEYGRGGTEVGVARARDISNKRNLSFDTVQRMNSYFSRHEVDKEATGWNQGEEGFPTAGRIAWQLWGGDAGRDWAKRIIERVNVEQSAHVCQSSNDFTDEEGRIFIDELKSKAEYIDIEEWELISEEDVLHPENELNYTSQLFNKMPSMSDAKGGDKSQWGDAGLYKLRYAYSQNLSANSREFCIDMVGMSTAGAVFRYEDIKRMSDKGVNGDFAPTGQSTYDIFVYKGGAFCHHFWKRQIYMRKRDSKGRILPNEGLENDKRVGNNPFVPKKGVEGVAPINTPSRGSITYA